MKAIEINCVVREDLGKKATKKIRRADGVPCVIYGGEKTIHVSAPERDFRPLVYTDGVYYAQLNIGDSHVKAIIKDMQFHPVSDKLQHIDFYEIDENKQFVVSVPVKLHGFAKGVQEGGKLNLDARRLNVKGALNDHVDIINLDIDDLAVGQSIRVADIKLDKLTFIEPANRSVASVKITRQAKEAETTAEGAAPAAAAAAPAAAAPAKA